MIQHMVAKKSPSLLNQARSFPSVPGVYQFLNAKEAVLYVGKALNLKQRIKSYFAPDLSESRPGLPLMLEQAVTLKYFETENEPEALLLEARLIRRLKPKYNIRLRDDKSFMLLTIDYRTPYPTIGTAREKDLEEILERSKAKLPGVERIKRRLENVEYYGPFPSAGSLKNILRFLRQTWPYRDCSSVKFAQYAKVGRPCIFGNLGLCPGPCQAKENNQLSQKSYFSSIQQVKQFLNGEQKQLKRDILKQIQTLAEAERFEEAALWRDRLLAIERFQYIVETFQLRQPEHDKTSIDGVSRYDKNADIRLEAFDISNNQGQMAVGSLVSAIISGGKEPAGVSKAEANKKWRWEKEHYRKYKIQTVLGSNDFEMLQEVLTRRLKRAKEWPLPDLFVLDGGIVQFKAVENVLAAWQLKHPEQPKPMLLAVSKGPTRKRTDLITKEWERFPAITRESWHLIAEKAREEAHRFAIDYYRGLHRRSVLK